MPVTAARLIRQSLCLGAACLLAPPAVAQQRPVAAIVGATLWDGTGAPALPGAVVLVQGERIFCAGPPAACPVPVGAERIDATGRYLIPGLIDTHAHLLFRPNGVTHPSLRSDLRDLLARGVTATRDMGNNPARLLDAVREAQPAPRVFPMQVVAGIHFFSPETERMPGGGGVRHAPASGGMRQLGWWPILYVAGGDPREIIRQAREAGAIGLKLYQDLDSTQVARLTAAAHAAGMPVWGHGWVQPASVREQSQAGQDGVVHAAGLAGELVARATRDTLRTSSALLQVTADSARTVEAARRPQVLATLDTLAAHGTFLEPTLHANLLSAERAGRSRRRNLALPDRYAIAASVFGMEITRQAFARGVPITAGTDHVAYGPTGERAQLETELALFVDSVGMTPERALLTATRDAAAAIGRPAADLGTIVAGMKADLVLLREDPLLDVRRIASVEWVMRGGVRYDPAELRGLP
jgi:imidazolonepropionase-like amidohydrolase